MGQTIYGELCNDPFKSNPNVLSKTTLMYLKVWSVFPKPGVLSDCILNLQKQTQMQTQPKTREKKRKRRMND